MWPNLPREHRWRPGAAARWSELRWRYRPKPTLADAHALTQEDEFGSHAALFQFLDSTTHELAALSDALGLEYFAHGAPGEVSI